VTGHHPASSALGRQSLLGVPRVVAARRSARWVQRGALLSTAPMRRFLVRLALSALAAFVTWYSISIAYFIDRSIATYGPNPRNWGAVYTP